MGLGLSFRHRLQHVRRGWPMGSSKASNSGRTSSMGSAAGTIFGSFRFGRIFEPLDRNKPIMPDLRTFTKLLAFHAILNYSYFMLSSSSHHTPDTWRSNPMTGRIFLGRYEAVRLLGEGGMGKVYLAAPTRSWPTGRHQGHARSYRSRSQISRTVPTGNPPDGPFPTSLRCNTLRCLD